MIPKVNQELKIDTILIDTEAKLTQKNIAKTLGISERTLRRAKKKFKDTCDVEGSLKKRGQKPKLDFDLKTVHFSF